MRPTQNAGVIIREARLRLGWSQIQLAEKLAVSQPAVAHWESGVHAPRWALLPRIAELLGIRREDLTGRPSDKPPVRTRYDAMLAWPERIADLRAFGVKLPSSVSFVGLSSAATAQFAITLDSAAESACFDAARPMDLAGGAPQGHGNLMYIEKAESGRRN